MLLPLTHDRTTQHQDQLATASWLGLDNGVEADLRMYAYTSIKANPSGFAIRRLRRLIIILIKGHSLLRACLWLRGFIMYNGTQFKDGLVCIITYIVISGMCCDGGTHNTLHIRIY